MAEDFGDYSGEKLFDWLLRMGQDAGGAAALSAADRLREALSNAKGRAASDKPSTRIDADEPEQGSSRWAKLDMREFTSIQDWPTLQEIINGKLDECSITYEWFHDEADRTFLLFRAEDAPNMVRAFDELITQVDVARQRAAEELVEDYSHSHDRAIDMRHAREQRESQGAPFRRTGVEERLHEKAEMARAAAEDLRKHDHGSPERVRNHDREKAQGR